MHKRSGQTQYEDINAPLDHLCCRKWSLLTVYAQTICVVTDPCKFEVCELCQTLGAQVLIDHLHETVGSCDTPEAAMLYGTLFPRCKYGSYVSCNRLFYELLWSW